MKKKNTKVARNKSETVSNLPRACADEEAAVVFMEAQRWGETPKCPHCGSETVYQMKSRDGSRNKRFLWRCRDCDKQYTVRVGTVFEDSPIPLRHWVYAFWRACTSKNGVSALEIQRQTGLSYKSALFMMHRIRYAMTDDPKTPSPLTGTVEVDETYVGGKVRHPDREARKKAGWMGDNKTPVVAMVQRGGSVRAMVMPQVNAKNLKSVMLTNVHRDSRIMTDEAAVYKWAGKKFKGGHHTVVHSQGEYVRGDVTTNTVEGFFSLLKRGIHGSYHAVSKQHLHRYVSEFSFRYNARELEDGERTILAIKKAEGKRLLYREPIKKK